MSTHAPWEPAFAGAAAALEQLLKALHGEDVDDWEAVVANAQKECQHSQETTVITVSSSTSKHAGQSSILRRTGAAVTSTPHGSNLTAEPHRGSERSHPAVSSSTSRSRQVATVHYQDVPQLSEHETSTWDRESLSLPDRRMKASAPAGRRGLSPGASPQKEVEQAQAELTLHPSGRNLDLEGLRLRLTGLIETGPSSEALSRTTTASAAAGGRGRALRSVADTPMTAMTARTEASDAGFYQAKAGDIFDEVIQTCSDLEQAVATASTTGGLPQSALVASTSSSALPSARWSARAAEAAVASAQAAETAAAQAAAASALAAKEAARAAAAAKAATGCYNGFVDWLVTSPSSQARTMPALPAAVAAPQTGSAQSQPQPRVEAAALDDDESSDDDPNEGVGQSALEKASASVKMPDIDLDEKIGRQEWLLLLQELDLDPDEGGEIFQRIRSQASAQEQSEGAFVVREFLVELHIEEDDAEGMQTFADALHKARRDVAKGNQAKRQTTDKRSAQRTLFDKVLRELSRNEIPTEEAWAIVASGQVQISRAEQSIVDQSWQSREEEFIQRVRQYLVEPPVVNATAGQVVCHQRCTAKVNEIVKVLKPKGEKFTDTEWDVTRMPESVLYVDAERPGYDCTVASPAGYKRLSDIVRESGEASAGGLAGSGLGSLFGGGGGMTRKASGPKPERKPVVFKDGVGSGDIVQGSIGTCFLLGAIGAIAGHNSKAIQHLFISYDVDVGVYGIRLNNNGDWVHVIIDDWFPVDEWGELLYSRCRDPQEVWVPLLEKAFCKLHTCYEMCDGGRPPEAIASFFGGVSGHFNIKRVHRKHPDRYFKLLKQARDRGWLLTTGFQQQAGKQVEGSGKCGEGMLSNGLVAGHAYAVLRVAEAEGNLLICCLNPWGTGEWTGKWSDRNDFGEWTPSMKKAVGYHKADDGRFWMSVEDFVAASSGVDYARTFGPNWKKITHYKQFSAKRMTALAKRNCNGRKSDELSFSKGDMLEVIECNNEWWLGQLAGSRKQGYFRGAWVEVQDKPVMCFDLVGTVDKEHESMTVVLMLMQPNSCMRRKYYKRKEDSLNYKDTGYGHLQFLVIAPDGTVAFKREGKKRCVWGELELPGGGLWKVYALSVDGHGGHCTIRAFLKNGTAVLKEVAGATFADIKKHIL